MDGTPDDSLRIKKFGDFHLFDAMYCSPRQCGKEEQYFVGLESLVYVSVPIRNIHSMFPCSSTVIVKTGRLVGIQSQVWVDASAVDPNNDSTLTQTVDHFSPL